MAGFDLICHLTTGRGGAEGDPSTPAASLGHNRASNRVDEIESTITANQTVRNRYFFEDTARIGDGDDIHTLKWIVFVTGAASLSAARIASFDNSTGIFKLDRPTLADALIGDTYRIFAKNNLFPDVTAEQAAAGDERFRCVFWDNQTGGNIINVRHYFFDLGVALDFARINQVTQLIPFLSRLDDQTDILDVLNQRFLDGGSDNFPGSGQWTTPFGRASGIEEDASIGNLAGNAVWLRRTIAAGSEFRRSVAVMLVVDTETTGQDPDPLTSAAIFPYDILGTPEAVLVPDRFGHRAGGVRYRGRVTAVGITPEVPIVGRPGRWAVALGDLGSIFTEDDPLAQYDTTDASGDVFATYVAPTIPPAIEGLTATVQLIIGAGEEVGDPVPIPDELGTAAMQIIAVATPSVTTSASPASSLGNPFFL